MTCPTFRPSSGYKPHLCSLCGCIESEHPRGADLLDTSAVAESIYRLIESAPASVYLDLGENLEALTDDATFRDLSEVTWSEDNATGVGIKYVRAPAPAGGWLPIETAPKDGTSVLTNDTTGLCQYCMAHWLAGDEWSGWVYDEEVANDSNPLGPQPTYFMRIGPIPTATQPKEPQE